MYEVGTEKNANAPPTLLLFIILLKGFLRF